MNPAEFLSVLYARHCQRAFLDEAVPRDILEAVLLAAGQAPSGKNSQPWKVTVAAGAGRDALNEALCAAYDAGEKGKADYEYSLLPPPAEWMDRARACGYALFDLKGIERKDYEARKAHGRENFFFFGAPVVMIFHLPRGGAREFYGFGYVHAKRDAGPDGTRDGKLPTIQRGRLRGYCPQEVGAG